MKSFDDISIRDCVSTNEHLSRFEEWEKDAKESRATLSRLPEVAAFINMLHRTDRAPVMKFSTNYQKAEKCGFPLTANPEEPDGVPSFSLNEFARLVLVLTDDETTRDAFQSAYSRTLSRRELDARVSRYSTVDLGKQLYRGCCRTYTSAPRVASCGGRREPSTGSQW
ncbi:hypothetical protein BWQ96_07863 [Gracilariopsis chorda]|uniref:Uncharacterized protein n=1 Tax=Gracilariopsis chorda TaxID=448386 RepID=A0A2V3IK18_9FLOR|nr:hypothetical protein BWQ96_07863 [Gracilariopsis chorda]|eukprot:PXF42422.1 hypothetical protein BWQ96_07863 [Gracilariopsis chorda]